MELAIGFQQGSGVPEADIFEGGAVAFEDICGSDRPIGFKLTDLDILEAEPLAGVFNVAGNKGLFPFQFVGFYDNGVDQLGQGNRHHQPNNRVSRHRHQHCFHGQTFVNDHMVGAGKGVQQSAFCTGHAGNQKRQPLAGDAIAQKPQSQDSSRNPKTGIGGELHPDIGEAGTVGRAPRGIHQFKTVQDKANGDRYQQPPQQSTAMALLEHRQPHKIAPFQGAWP